MKIVIIGDTHGRIHWKSIVEKEKDADKIIFIGDYFDSFDILAQNQLENFLDIIQYKKDNMDKVVLLFGNHDYHYYMYNQKMGDERYSGFIASHALQFKEVLEQAIKDKLILMCYKEGELCCTHAGITQTWLDNNNYDGEEDLESFINTLFEFKPSSFRFVGRNVYGDSVESSPIWVRPDSLMKDPPKETLTQIVGHTHQNLTIDNHKKLKYAFIDSLDIQVGYNKFSSYLKLEVDNGVIQTFEIKNL